VNHDCQEINNLDSKNKLPISSTTAAINQNSHRLKALFNNNNYDKNDLKQNSNVSIENFSKELKFFKDKIEILETKLNKYKKM
jgi:hypothetical protein